MKNWKVRAIAAAAVVMLAPAVRAQSGEDAFRSRVLGALGSTSTVPPVVTLQATNVLAISTLQVAGHKVVTNSGATTLILITNVTASGLVNAGSVTSSGVVSGLTLNVNGRAPSFTLNTNISVQAADGASTNTFYYTNGVLVGVSNP